MRQLRRSLTTRGAAFAGSGVVLVAAGILLGQHDVTRVGILLLALTAIALVLVRRHGLHLDVVRTATPSRVAIDERAVVTVRIRNVEPTPSPVVMAEESIDYIEREVRDGGRTIPEVDDSKAIELRPERSHGYIALLRVLFKTYPKRSILGATLMITQSFLYNSIFFTYTIVLGTFYGVEASATPWYLIAFAVGNFVGPLALGHLFDTLGRRKMIAGTYILSGVLLAISAFLFNAGLLNALTQTIAWCIIFFFASAGASSAYLTVSEIFPLEVRAMAIAVFFAIAQGFGALGPVLYGALIGDGSNPTLLVYGYLLAAVIMIIGGLVETFLGIDAENKPLEDVAQPLTFVGGE